MSLLHKTLCTNTPNQTRPIIFICHSLGGLVVKDALIKAASHDSHKRDRDLALIYQHTKGVLFLGTPHRGSQQEPFGDLLARAANLSLHQANTQLLRSLRTDSHILEKQRDDFVTISNNLLVRCVKEERPTALGIVSSPAIYARSLTNAGYRSYPSIPQITTALTSRKAPSMPITLTW
jgi:hypothetical protein